MQSRGYLIPLLTLALLSPWHPTPTSRSSQRVWFASAALVNFTIDDTSTLVVYSPAELWRPSTAVCGSCLQPDLGLAYAGTWHDGTHVIPTVDDDDLPGGQDLDKSKGSGTSSSAQPPAPTQTNGKDDDNDDSNDKDHGGKDDDGKDDNDTKGKGGHKRQIIQTARAKQSMRDDSDDGGNPFFTEKEDSDDAGFVDQPIFASFNFTGSAVFVYALVPLFTAAANTTPTFVNLTYTLDSQASGQFLHSGSPSSSVGPSSYLSSVAVFEKSGLPEGPHSLIVNVGPDSVFLFDYIVYTQDSQFGTGGSIPSGPTSTNGAGNTSGSQPPASVGEASPTGALNQATDTATPSSKSHNVATFAGAVGGSVGLLSVLALSLAFSIYRRRLKARRRDDAYRQGHRGGERGSVSSFHTDASEDGPPMQGPAPFVPRYFPGTIINTAPPPYSLPAPSSNEPTSALLGTDAPGPAISWFSRRSNTESGDSDSASYADRPPPTPPLNPLAGAAEVEDTYFAPPPSFQVAIASPIPAILAGLSGTTTESPSLAVRAPSPSPPSPVIPLLAPPPSARPVSIAIAPTQTAGSQASLIINSEPSVSPRSSTRSLRTQSSQGGSTQPTTVSQPRSSRDSHGSFIANSAAAISASVAEPHADSREHEGSITGDGDGESNSH